MLPATVDSATISSEAVPSVMLPVAVTSSDLASTTEAVFESITRAFSSAVSAEIMPPRRANVPGVVTVTSCAAPKPVRPPMKPTTDTPLVNSKYTSWRARKSHLVPASWVA